MIRVRWKPIMMAALFLSTQIALAAPLSTVMELETNLTIKIKSIVQPVDPEAMVIVNVTPRRVNTNLPVTGMEAFGFFTVEQAGRVEDSDVDSVRVQIYSSVENFPDEVSRIIESAVKPYTKKGQVTISKIDDATSAILKKRKESANIQADSLQKISMEYSEHLYRLVYILAGSVGSVILVVSVMMIAMLMRAFKGLATKIGEIKIDTGGGNAPSMLPELAAASRETTRGGGSAGAGAIAGGPTMDDMGVVSLKAILSDCYWCEKDAYANWIWAQISPSKKTELLQSWPELGAYVEHFSLTQAGEERYHNDPFYLYPTPLENISNDDLMRVLSTNKLVWWGISSMRKESVNVSLRDRIDFNRGGARGSAVQIPTVKSAARALPMQLQISSLSEDDEMLLFEQPYLVSAEVARKLPSLVWLALLPAEDCVKIMNSVSAQSLADCWVGPAAVLERLQNQMPEKRRALFGEYLTKARPRRGSPFLKTLTDAAVPILEKQWPQEPGAISESNAA